MSKRESRLAKLEAGSTGELSERVKAWFGMRGPLTAADEAAEPDVDPTAVDLSDCSPQMREWLSQ